MVPQPSSLSETQSNETVSQQEAVEIARDAYVYAYPLVLTHTTLQLLSNFAEPAGPGHGPPNQFHHVREFPDANAKTVVRENVDTLYTARHPRSKGGAFGPFCASDRPLFPIADASWRTL